MVPLRVVFWPITMDVGETVIVMEPISIPVHACTRIDVKTSREVNSKTVKCVVDRLLNFSLSSSFTQFVKSYFPLLKYLSSFTS